MLVKKQWNWVMKILAVEDLKVVDLKSVLQGDRLVLTHRGAPKFALISISDLHLLEAMELESLEKEDDGDELRELLGPLTR